MPDPTQQEMFESSPYGMVETPRNTDPEVSQSTEGVSVGLEDRREALLGAMATFGKISKATGLSAISETRGRRALEARYEDVDRVVGGSRAKQDERERKLEKQFNVAFGLKAMTDVLNEGEAERMSRETFSVFVQKFADKKGAIARGDLRKHFRKKPKNQLETRH